MQEAKGVLLTGCTGLLGEQILKNLISNTSSPVYLLIRGSNTAVVYKKFENLVRKLDGDLLLGRRGEVANRVKIVVGDLVKARIGIEPAAYKFLTRKIVEIYHCAALTNFQEPFKKVSKVNKEGTKSVLEFASSCRNLEKVNYVSSVFIAGNYRGVFCEKDLNKGQEFNNPYEQSKFEAELLIRKYQKGGLNISIFRPSVITGEYHNGAAHNFGLLYRLFRMLSLKLFEELPVNDEAFLNLIPCDMAAQFICLLSKNYKCSDTYHILSKNNVSLKHVIMLCCTYCKLRAPKLVKFEKFKPRNLTIIQKRILAPFIPYFNLGVIFDSRVTNEKMRQIGVSQPLITDYYVRRILEYSQKKGFIKK